MTGNSKPKDIKIKGRISIGPLTIIIDDDISGTSAKIGETLHTDTPITLQTSLQKIEEALEIIKNSLREPNAED